MTMLILPNGRGAAPPPGLLADRWLRDERGPRVVRQWPFAGLTDARGRLIIPLDAAITVVQTPGIYSWDNAASGTRAFSSGVTAGNAIFIGFAGYNTGGNAANPSAIGDTLGNSYTRDVTVFGAADPSRVDFIASAPNISGGSCTITVTFPSSAYFCRGVVTEVSGLATSSMLDGSNSATGTSTSPSVSLAVAASDSFVLGHVGVQPPFTSVTITPNTGGGWTQLGEFENGGAGPPFNAQRQIFAASGVKTPSWTLGSSQPWSALVAAYGAPAAAAVGAVLVRRRSSLICR